MKKIQTFLWIALCSQLFIACGEDEDNSNDGGHSDAEQENEDDALDVNCGDGQLEGDEVCDDGNTTDFDGCSSTCEVEILCEDGEHYTSETWIADGATCRCPAAVVACTGGEDILECGNGTIEEGESCDDGNLIDGDGCNDQCQEEQEPDDGLDEWGANTEIDRTRFSDFVSNKNVIALGESLHESAGITLEKLKLLQWLVEDHGYRHIALEYRWGDTQDLSTFLKSCDYEELPAAFEAAFGTNSFWMTDGVYQTMQWLCEWNTINPNAQVSLFGIDARQPYIDTHAIETIVTLGQEVNKQYANEIDSIFRCVSKETETWADWVALYSDDEFHSEEDYQACINAIGTLRNALDTHALDDLSEADEILLRKHLHSLETAELEQYHFGSAHDAADAQGPQAAMLARTKGMTGFIELFHEEFGSETQFAISASALHVSQHGLELSSYEWSVFGGWLKENYGPSLGTIGVSARVLGNRNYEDVDLLVDMDTRTERFFLSDDQTGVWVRPEAVDFSGFAPEEPLFGGVIYNLEDPDFDICLIIPTSLADAEPDWVDD